MITSASVTFVINNAPESYNHPIDIIIEAENLGSSRNAFGNFRGQGEPEDRLSAVTDASVNWQYADFPDVGEKVVTTDISPLLQELVSDYRWDPVGTDVVFLFRRNPNAAAEDQGSREFEAYDGTAASAAQLNYTYQERQVISSYFVPSMSNMIIILLATILLGLGRWQYKR